MSFHLKRFESSHLLVDETEFALAVYISHQKVVPMIVAFCISIAPTSTIDIVRSLSLNGVQGFCHLTRFFFSYNINPTSSEGHPKYPVLR